MEDGSRLSNLVRTYLEFLPQVQRANQPIPFRDKCLYTAASLIIFMAGSQLPLYGIQSATGGDPFSWSHLIFASNRGTLMAMGIIPILVPEMIVKSFRSLIINMDNSVPKAQMLLDGVQKLLGIFATLFWAIIYVLWSGTVSELGTCTAVLIALQIFFSGIMVIYLDEVLKKGYGLLPITSLFTAANVCANILWKAFSPYQEQGAQFEGAVIALVHLLVSRTDKFSATCEALYRRNLPNIINLVAACEFCLFAMYFQGFSIVLPVRADDICPGFQFNYRFKLFNFAYVPIFLQRAFITILYLISELLYVTYGENTLLNLLGRWKGSSKHFGQHVPVGGIVYYVTAPPTFVDLLRDPVHAFLYIFIVLGASALLLGIWLRLCMSSKGFSTGLLRANGEPSLTIAQPDSIPANEFWSHVDKAARLGGLSVGALIVFADLVGVTGSGAGIMLAVAAVYPYFEGGRDVEVSVSGL